MRAHIARITNPQTRHDPCFNSRVLRGLAASCILDPLRRRRSPAISSHPRPQSIIQHVHTPTIMIPTHPTPITPAPPCLGLYDSSPARVLASFSSATARGSIFQMVSAYSLMQRSATNRQSCTTHPQLPHHLPEVKKPIRATLVMHLVIHSSWFLNVSSIRSCVLR